MRVDFEKETGIKIDYKTSAAEMKEMIASVPAADIAVLTKPDLPGPIKEDKLLLDHSKLPSSKKSIRP